jgi:hypothetical protein
LLTVLELLTVIAAAAVEVDVGAIVPVRAMLAGDPLLTVPVVTAVPELLLMVQTIGVPVQVWAFAAFAAANDNGARAAATHRRFIKPFPSRTLKALVQACPSHRPLKQGSFMSKRLGRGGRGETVSRLNRISPR